MPQVYGAAALHCIWAGGYLHVPGSHALTVQEAAVDAVADAEHMARRAARRCRLLRLGRSRLLATRHQVPQRLQPARLCMK